ncbi:hypothetical protein [Ensifer adhaerens]|uniref:hypothetical protein n=1 Tax=Ensifer adhaerens TaxID=106592 RepID=UPI000CF168DC|nr:hypothetical protein [Ensifer adhaerens]
MPLRVPEKVAFLDGEIAGLQARIGGEGNAVQLHKMEMLSDIRDDYRKSIEAARKREEASE